MSDDGNHRHQSYESRLDAIERALAEPGRGNPHDPAHRDESNFIVRCAKILEETCWLFFNPANTGEYIAYLGQGGFSHINVPEHSRINGGGAVHVYKHEDFDNAHDMARLFYSQSKMGIGISDITIDLTGFTGNDLEEHQKHRSVGAVQLLGGVDNWIRNVTVHSPKLGEQKELFVLQATGLDQSARCGIEKSRITGLTAYPGYDMTLPPGGREATHFSAQVIRDNDGDVAATARGLPVRMFAPTVNSAPGGTLGNLTCRGNYARMPRENATADYLWIPERTHVIKLDTCDFEASRIEWI